MISEDRVKIFCVYSHSKEDTELKQKLDKHLQSKNESIPMYWDDREITPGQEWATEIEAHLNEADIILLLISPDFMASDACYKDMKTALARHDNKEDVLVIPIILRSVNWDNAPFSKLQMLPTGTKPINRWSDIDEACVDVKKGINRAVKRILAKREMVWQKEQAREQWRNQECQRTSWEYDARPKQVKTVSGDLLQLETRSILLTDLLVRPTIHRRLRWIDNGAILLIILILFTTVFSSSYSSMPTVDHTLALPNGSGAVKAPNGEYVGINNGQIHLFDTGPQCSDSHLKQRAEQALQSGDLATATALWNKCILGSDLNDVLAMIYLQNQVAFAFQHITLILCINFQLHLSDNSLQSMLRGAYIAQKYFNDQHTMKLFLLIANIWSDLSYSGIIAIDAAKAAKRDKNIIGILW